MTQTYQPISGLVALAEASIEGDDIAVVVDVHDTTQAPTGSTKKITLADLRTALLTGTNGAFAADRILTLGAQSYTWPVSQTASGFLQTDGAGNLSWVAEHTSISLAQLTDVALTTPASGQWLGYDGALWVNHTPVAADITDLTTAATGITSVGTITTGTWQATAIDPAYLAGFGAAAGYLRSTGSAWARTSGVAYTDLTYSGLTTGQVLRATGAGAAAFGALDLANTSAVTGLLPWANVDKTGSSLADLTTRSAADLSSGTLPDARFPATLPALSGVNLTALNASALGSGNVPYARMATGNGSWDTGPGTTITITRALTVSGTLTGALTGNASTATALATPRNINAVPFDGSADITVTAAAGTLTGTVLNATVVTSSLTAVGTIATGVWQASVVTTTYGGTGLAAYTAGDLPYYASGAALSNLGIGTAGKLLRSTGSAPAWSTLTYPDTVTAGDLAYGSALNVVGFLGKGTARQLLQMNAAGTFPEWASNVSVQGTLDVAGIATFAARVTAPVVAAGLATPHNKVALDVQNPDGTAAQIGALFRGTTGAAGECPTIGFMNPAGAIRSIFDSEGMYTTNGSMTISGGFQATYGSNGVISWTNPLPTVGYMLAVISDITSGPAIISRGTAGGGWNYMAQTEGALYVFGIDMDGKAWWGNTSNGSTSWDTNLYRSAAGTLKTDGSLLVASSLGATGARVTKGWFTDLEVTNAIAGSVTGSAATLTTPRAINGVNFDGSAAITVTAAAGTLTGTTLNATVVTSSLTAIGTLSAGAVPASLVTAGTFGAGAYTFPSTLTVTGSSITLGVQAALAAPARASTAADATFSVPIGSGAIVVARDRNHGAVALVLVYDASATPVIISDPLSNFTATDPGSGGNKIFLARSGTNLVMTNRFATGTTLAGTVVQCDT